MEVCSVFELIKPPSGRILDEKSKSFTGITEDDLLAENVRTFTEVSVDIYELF